MFHLLFSLSISTCLIAAISCAHLVENIYVNEPALSGINLSDPEARKIACELVGTKYMDLMGFHKLTIDNIVANNVPCGSFFCQKSHEGSFTEGKTTMVFDYPPAHKYYQIPKDLAEKLSLLRSPKNHIPRAKEVKPNIGANVTISNINNSSGSLEFNIDPHSSTVTHSGDARAPKTLPNKPCLINQATLGTPKAKIVTPEGTYNINISQVVPGTNPQFGEVYVSVENGFMEFSTRNGRNIKADRDPEDRDCAIITTF